VFREPRRRPEVAINSAYTGGKPRFSALHAATLSTKEKRGGKSRE
jgi:hypothetical protein